MQSTGHTPTHCRALMHSSVITKVTVLLLLSLSGAKVSVSFIVYFCQRTFFISPRSPAPFAHNVACAATLSDFYHSPCDSVNPMFDEAEREAAEIHPPMVH